MTNYSIGDFLTRIKNAAMAKRVEVVVKKTKLAYAVSLVLKKEGFLRDVEVVEGDLKVSLAYSHKEPVLMGLKLVSKPGLRVYKGVDQMGKRRILSSILIVSTPKGVVSSKEAIKLGTGGEVIVEVW